MASLDDPPPAVVERMAKAHFDALPEAARAIVDAYNAIPGANPLEFYRTTAEEAATWGPDSEAYLALRRAGPKIVYASAVPSQRAVVHELLHVKSLLIEGNPLMSVKNGMERFAPLTDLGVQVDHLHVIHAESEMMGEVHPKWRTFLAGPPPQMNIDAQTFVRWLVAFRLFGDEALASPLGRRLADAGALDYALNFYRAAERLAFDHDFIMATLVRNLPQHVANAMIRVSINGVTMEHQFTEWGPNEGFPRWA